MSVDSPGLKLVRILSRRKFAPAKSYQYGFTLFEDRPSAAIREPYALENWTEFLWPIIEVIYCEPKGIIAKQRYVSFS